MQGKGFATDDGTHEINPRGVWQLHRLGSRDYVDQLHAHFADRRLARLRPSYAL